MERLGRAIAVSTSAARFIQRVFPRPVEVIPNGLDVASFTGDASLGSQLDQPAASTGEGPSAERPPQVLFVGRFGEPRKGLACLLEAASSLRAGGSALEILVAGEGPRERFQDLATRAGAVFLGRVGDRELAALYRRSDVFCAPSLGGESFGIVLAEAMAAGCPVLASNIPGYAEAAQGAAQLFEPGSVSDLAATLGTLLDAPERREALTVRGRKRAAELDWARVAIQIRALYGLAIERSA